MRRVMAFTICTLWLMLISACSPVTTTDPTPTPATHLPQPTQTKTRESLVPAKKTAEATQPPTYTMTTAAQPSEIFNTIIPRGTPVENTPTPDPHIAQVQARLIDLGYVEVGSVNGILSEQTKAAISHFQYLNHLETSGILDEDTHTALEDPSAISFHLPPPFPGFLIEPGIDLFGEQALHARLAELGYIEFDEEEWFTNQYGPTTQDAVRRFQENSAIETSGRVDLETWQALFSPWAVPAEGEGDLLQPTPDAWTTNIYPVGQNPYALTSDDRRIWVVHRAEGSYLDNYILAIDPEEGISAVSVPILVSEPWVYAQPIGSITFANNHLWLLFPNDDNPGEGPYLRRLPVDTGVLSERLEFAECPDGFCFPSRALGYDGALLWASAGGQIIGIDPATSKPVQSHQIGWMANGEIIQANGCLWMSGEVGLTAFNPAGGECPSAELAYALPGDALAFDGLRIWGASTDGGFINWLHLGTGELGTPIEINGGPSALAYDGERLWVALQQTDSLVIVDVDRGTLGDPLPVCLAPVALRIGFMRLWVACAGSQTVQSLYYDRYSIDQGSTRQLASPTPALSASSTPIANASLTATHIPTLAPPPLQRNLFLTSPRFQGDDVFILQERLLELGYSEVGELDGIFGPKTEQAVKHFQQVNGLVVDGFVGPQTWALLFSPAAKAP